MASYGTYDRYSKFREGGEVKFPPFVKIREQNTDKTIVYRRGYTRMDIVSYEYYGDPNYGWLIMYANPSLGMSEFLIPDGSSMRIPYPLDSALTLYKAALEKYITENGSN